MERIAGRRVKYEIDLPNGKTITIWFIGEQLERILDAYGIPYRIIRKRL